MNDFSNPLYLELLKNDVALIKDLGIFGLQALITINAGAVIALMAFVSNIQDVESYSINIEQIKYAVICFLVGLFLAFISIAITYIYTQYYLYKETGMNIVCHLLLMMLPSLFSFICFAAGSCLTLFSIKAA